MRKEIPTEMTSKLLKKLRTEKAKFEEDENGLLWINVDSKLLLVLPQKYVKRTIALSHDSLIGGHRDVMKTMEQITKVYWWPNMKADIHDYIMKCETCQRIKGPRSKTF